MFMLKELNCELLDYTVNRHHFASVIIAFKKGNRVNEKVTKTKEINEDEILKRYSTFKESLSITNRRLQSLKNETTYGFGAALMLPILSYHLKNDFSSLKCILDDDKLKEGLRYINVDVDIRTTENIHDIHNSISL